MTETLTACPICQSENIYTRSKAHGVTPVSVCKDCDQHFVNPRMTDDEATAFYQGEYWDKMNGARAAENLIRHRERARFQALELARWVKDARTCLEIGCSAGYLMDYLNIHYDIECYGVEPDTRHHEFEPAKHYQVYTDLSRVPDRRFDILAMSHSLEHLNHPLEFMRNLIDHHAHDGTRLMIEVPNLDTIPNTLTPQHPFGFSERTLNQLFLRFGYAPLVMVKHGLGAHRPFYLLAMYGRVNA